MIFTLQLVIHIIKRQLKDMLIPSQGNSRTKSQHRAEDKQEEGKQGRKCRTQQQEKKSEIHQRQTEKRLKMIKWHLLCWGPPSDLDTPGPSSVVCKYHQPLNEQWRDKSFEMNLHSCTIMGGSKGHYSLFRLK